jgi:hypothetical protein
MEEKESGREADEVERESVEQSGGVTRNVKAGEPRRRSAALVASFPRVHPVQASLSISSRSPYFFLAVVGDDSKPLQDCYLKQQ